MTEATESKLWTTAGVLLAGGILLFFLPLSIVLCGVIGGLVGAFGVRRPYRIIKRAHGDIDPAKRRRFRRAVRRAMKRRDAAG